VVAWRLFENEGLLLEFYMGIEPNWCMKAFEGWRRRLSESCFRAKERRKEGGNSGTEEEILYDFERVMTMGIFAMALLSIVVMFSQLKLLSGQ
jgi:hypothetical protein